MIRQSNNEVLENDAIQLKVPIKSHVFNYVDWLPIRRSIQGIDSVDELSVNCREFNSFEMKNMFRRINSCERNLGIGRILSHTYTNALVKYGPKGFSAFLKGNLENGFVFLITWTVEDQEYQIESYVSRIKEEHKLLILNVAKKLPLDVQMHNMPIVSIIKAKLKNWDTLINYKVRCVYFLLEAGNSVEFNLDETYEHLDNYGFEAEGYMNKERRDIDSYDATATFPEYKIEVFLVRQKLDAGPFRKIEPLSNVIPYNDYNEQYYEKMRANEFQTIEPEKFFKDIGEIRAYFDAMLMAVSTKVGEENTNSEIFNSYFALVIGEGKPNFFTHSMRIGHHTLAALTTGGIHLNII